MKFRFGKKGRTLTAGMTLLLAFNLLPEGPAGAAGLSETAGTGSSLPAVNQTGLTGLEAFTDEFMQELTGTEGGAPGAAVAVVQDGRVILNKGYGLADIEKKIPVDPDKTLFRIGSVTKTFTAAAIMQLAEQGKIDLHADIQQYLGGIKLDNPFDVPVTVHDLLTHTSGFRVSIDQAEDFSTDLVHAISLKEYVEKKKPSVVRKPGSAYMYDNYAYNLLGYIIGNVSGVPYRQYMKENLLRPLGMTETEPALTEPLLSRMATGYEPDNSVTAPYVLGPAELPSGGMLSTAGDVARFMTVQLNGGVYGDTRVWKEATVAQMLHFHSAIHPDYPDSTYGYENWLQTKDKNGQNIVVKGGDINGYSSFILLLPEQKTGVFMAFNKLVSSTDVAVKWNRSFMDRYFPAENTGRNINLDTPTQQLKRFEGVYADLRISMLLTKITATGRGELTVHDGILGERKLKQVAPLLFEDEAGTVLAFREEPNGSISYMKYANPVSYARKHNSVFKDLRDDSPYAPHILRLEAMELLRGVDSQKYAPSIPITRAQFASVLVRTMGLELSGEPVRFLDTAGSWAEREVETAVAAGFMEGITDRKFGPDQPLTRQEAAAVLLPVLRSAAPAVSAVPAGEVKLAEQIDPALAEPVKQLIAAGLTGPDVKLLPDGSVSFRPNENLTRQEAAVWFDHFIKLALGLQ